jgi:hypothetical protein
MARRQPSQSSQTSEHEELEGIRGIPADMVLIEYRTRLLALATSKYFGRTAFILLVILSGIFWNSFHMIVALQVAGVLIGVFWFIEVEAQSKTLATMARYLSRYTEFGDIFFEDDYVRYRYHERNALSQFALRIYSRLEPVFWFVGLTAILILRFPLK